VDVGIVCEILLCADENDWHAGTEVLNFRHPLVYRVLETVRCHDTKADHDYVGVGIRQGPEKEQRKQCNYIII